MEIEEQPAFIDTSKEVKSLGQMLIEAKLLTSIQLERAKELHNIQGGKLSEVLVKNGLITSEDLTGQLSIQMNLPFIDLKRHIIQQEALKLIPESMARKHNIIPLDIIGDSLMIVMSDPDDIKAINEITAQSQIKVQLAIGIPGDIREAIDLNYKSINEIEKEISRITPASLKTTSTKTTVSVDMVGENPIVRITDLLISQAARQRASDIHIEPQKERLRVRYRIDGVLHDIVSLPMSTHPALLSRIKIMADMNIAERRLPQDGQIAFKFDNKEVDIRVATIDTAWGETVVMRLLDKSRSLLKLIDLGFLPDSLQKFNKMLRSPFGLIIIAGPTGAGKTTTLYAAVNSFNRQENNIITIEDPVEYQFADITQMQVNLKAGLTFAGCLRATMRLDPDIILIGEMRDNDTANTGIQAALTGRLVLSSIHGNDAPSALLRLANLSTEAFLASSALIGVVSQRMVRRVCPHCRSLVERPLPEKTAYSQITGENRSKFAYGSGCNFCTHTGYLGRTGIFEILEVTDNIRHLMNSSATVSQIREQAIKEGMLTMMHDGMLKVKEGITTPSEVLRNVFY